MCSNETLDDFNIKLCDFGFSTFFDSKKKMSLSLGSPLYMAPEIHRDEEYDERVDVWSLGVITYILLHGKPPYLFNNENDMVNAIMSKEIVYDKKDWSKLSPTALSFVKLCLNRDAKNRASVS